MSMFKNIQKVIMVVFSIFIVLVDNSLKISNIFTPRDFELAIKMIKLIVENENKYIFFN